MAGISDEKLQELRDRVDVAQVVARRVQLKRSGHDLRGLCPFHGEKTPSFYVVPDKRIYHCFGCGKTGDAIRFVMEMEGRSFREAVEQLATEFGVTLEADDPAERQRTARRAAIAEVNDKAATFYERVLWEHPKGKIARDHLEARSCSVETAKAWRLGYAPNLWDSLCKSLTRGKIDLQLADEAGLVVPRKQGTGRGSHYDRFRGRLVIPIRESGRTVAFGGRLLEGESEAKYLNSPETALYQKGSTLFGLDKAREAIRKEGVVLFVEGYFDAIGLHQAGVQTAVATCGTAMTDRHLELVTRAGAKELVFVFDGDSAGIRAATRASEIAAAAGISARVLVPPDGEDPDETVLRVGLEAFRGLLAAAAPSLEFLLDRALAAVGQGASIEARVRIVDSVAGIIRASPSPLARDLYIEKVAQKLGASADAVRMAVERSAELAGKPMPEAQRPRLQGVQPGRGPQQQGQDSRPKPKAEEPKPFVRPVPREVRLQEFSLVARMLQSNEHVKSADESGHIHAFLHAELRELAEKAFAAAREGLFDGRALISTLEDEASRRELQQRFDEAALATAHGLAADPRFGETDRRGLLLALQKHARAAAEEEIRRRPKLASVKPPKPDQKTGA